MAEHAAPELPKRCHHCAGPLSKDMIGSAVGGTAGAFYAFNHAMPVVRRYIKGPMWMHFLVGAPPVVVFSSACAGLAVFLTSDVSLSLPMSKYNNRLIAWLHGMFAYVEECDMKKKRELDIFTADRYFNAADAVKYSAAAVHADDPPRQLPVAAVDAAASQSSLTAASSEVSWNSRSGLLASNQSPSAARQHDKGYGGGVNGVVVLDTRDDRYHRGGKKPAAAGFGQRWGIFSRDCPCAGRKAVTVDVASEPTTPRVHARFDAREESAVFKANGLPPPSTNDEPGVMKIFTTGSCAFPLRANNNILAPATDHGTSASFPAFPPDVGRRVVSSGGFTFPVISPSKAISSSVVDEPPRESLEVFRPIDEDSVVLVDPPPPLAAAAFLRAPAVVSAMDDDAMSDASSDLFDLESFAASSSYPTTGSSGSTGERRRGRIGSSRVETLPKNLIAVLPGRISNDRVPEAPALPINRARGRRDGIA
uniref:Uncharacterized protein n=1 Tax=Aegilops tauschii TaxID=37682 RepID=M8C8P2_AEGTA